jgi:hypothetical protein
MDFIEQIFGISPDGENALFEVLAVLIPIASGITWGAYWNWGKA